MSASEFNTFGLKLINPNSIVDYPKMLALLKGYPTLVIILQDLK